MAIREGRWDCTSCGSVGNLGRDVHCAGCGRPRPADVRFYLPSDAPVVSDAARLAEATAGADWECAHCAASNRATLAACNGCGAPRGSISGRAEVDYATGAVPRVGDEGVPVSAAEQADPSEVPPSGIEQPRPAADLQPSEADPAAVDAAATPAASGEAASSADAPAPAEASSTPSPSAETARSDAAPAAKPKPRRRRRVLRVVGGIVALFLLWVEWNFATAPHPAKDRIPGVVVSREWTREVVLGREAVIEQGRWEPEPPFEARYYAKLVRTEQRFHHYDSVRAGYRTESREVQREVEVADGYETVTDTVTEYVNEGSRSYVCGQRDMGNGYFADRYCTEPNRVARTSTRQSRRARYRTEKRWMDETVRIPVYRRVPVMRPWHVYRWVDVVGFDTLRNTSAAGPPPWPVPPGSDTTVKQKDRNNRLVLTVQVDGWNGTREIYADEYEWWRFVPGTRVAYSGFASLLPADSLMACIRWHEEGGPPPPARLGCSPRRPARR